MDTIDEEATSNQLTGGQTNKEMQSEMEELEFRDQGLKQKLNPAPASLSHKGNVMSTASDCMVLNSLFPVLNPEDSSEEEEDFLSGLSPDEKECLEYLLQTINTLDKDLLEDDDEVIQEQRTDSLGSEDQCDSSVNSSSTQQSLSVEAVRARPGQYPEVSKTTPLSEESGGNTQHRPDPSYQKAKGPPQSVDAHPAHCRKFDTIMRSGVNVQELRSRFLLHFDSSAAPKEQKEAAAATVWQPELLPGGQTSPRDEALQKLGLLQGNATVPNMSSPHVSMTSPQAQISLAERLNQDESAPVSFSTTGEPMYPHTMVTVQEHVLPQQELNTRKC